MIAVEQQAHGRTADVDRPLMDAQMAGDTAALLRRRGAANADFFGWSMGAGVATQIGIERPELVRKLVLPSPAYSRDGFHLGLLEGIENVIDEHNVAPRPGYR
ncbi:MAG TPA: hypothetical protein VKF37_05120 [Chloroflexota bacterium]|nr:hypothetical protein [Chloroflexota bacterium]